MATQYYFPNYPYNDLREDPFLLDNSNAYNAECNTYLISVTVAANYKYTDCFTNDEQGNNIGAGQTIEICSTTIPTLDPPDAGIITVRQYDTYKLSVDKSPIITRTVHFAYKDVNNNDRIIAITARPFERASKATRQIQVFPDTVPTVAHSNTDKYTITKLGSGGQDIQNNTSCYPNRLNAFSTDESKYRHVFNSPETSFGQPFLGNVLKIENVIFGAGKGHFVEVQKNALYKLITKEAQEDALKSSEEIGDAESTAMFTAYQAYLQIYINGITRRNYGWSYNSIASYDYYADVQNGLGIKQRLLDNSQYLIPGVQSINEEININNYQRESSVYLKTRESVSPLPFPSQTDSLLYGSGQSRVEDKSRFISSQINCTQPEEQFDISVVSYYGSIKNVFPNQWGQMYSYETIDTGFQTMFSDEVGPDESSIVTIFGGDTFINKFAFKTKLPFFIDNRVGAPDDSDIFYDELGNVAYPEYWHSARSILYDYVTSDGSGTLLKSIISIKAHNLDCPNFQTIEAPISGRTDTNRTYYDGKMYMFAYGIPYFYCESSVNVDLRQAFNSREGEFYPHVSSGIPDAWLQESFVPISQDNTYYYNVSYSKQNKENFFTHLPVDWQEKLCFTAFPFKAVYSEQQLNFTDNRVNNWLIYRPISFFDFPQNYGELVSLDGIQDRQVLARFENKSLLYNVLYTNRVNTGGQVYLGQSLFSTGTPPLDFAETDLGYVGTQHKFLLKIPQGQITVDAKRGQIFLISGTKAQDISALGSGLKRFLTDHLPFEIINYFPEIDIDNHFNNLGLHGVYDSKYDRVIISKLDYTPLSSDIKWDSTTNEFYLELTYEQESSDTTTTTTTTPEPLVVRKVVYLTDPTYFCNKSWTLSFNLNTQTWISFHSYIPNWYMAENNFFYSGLNGGCDLEVVVFEEIPTTTTTSTSSTTTTTTTVAPTTTTTSTSTSTTTSSTTTTTTTTISPTTTTTTTLALVEYCYTPLWNCEDNLHVPPGGTITYYDQFGDPHFSDGYCDDGTNPVFTFFSSSVPVTNAGLVPTTCP